MNIALMSGNNTTKGKPSPIPRVASIGSVYNTASDESVGESPCYSGRSTPLISTLGGEKLFIAEPSPKECVNVSPADRAMEEGRLGYNDL